MGQFGSGNVYMSFESEKDAIEVEKMLNNIEKHIKKRTKKEIYTNLYNIKRTGEGIDLELSSSRVQNADWQVEQIINELKLMVQSKKISAVIDFTADVMTEHNSWCLEEDEFHEEIKDEDEGE